jgi:predicted amidohydrolase
MSRLRIAMVNFCPVYGDVEANLGAVEQQVRAAAAQGAQLVCFPEMCLTGYASASTILDDTLCMEGGRMQRLGDLSLKTGVAFAVGMPEWEAESQKAFITQVCCLPDGRMISYRKAHLSQREAKTFQAGDRMVLFDLQSFTFGMQICYDIHFPEYSLAQALAGAQVILVCSASPMGSAQELREGWTKFLPARAYDNGCYVLICNQHGAAPSGLSFSGLAMAFNPHGVLIGESDRPDVPLLVDVESELVVQSRQKRPFFQARRPQIYHLA